MPSILHWQLSKAKFYIFSHPPSSLICTTYYDFFFMGHQLSRHWGFKEYTENLGWRSLTDLLLLWRLWQVWVYTVEVQHWLHIMKLSDITGTWNHLIYRFKLQPSKTDLDQASNWAPVNVPLVIFIFRVPPNPPSEHVRLPVSEHISHEEDELSCTCTEGLLLHFFFLSSPISLPHIFHTSGNCYFFRAHKYHKSQTSGRWIWDFFSLISSLDCFVDKSFSVSCKHWISAAGLLYVKQANLNQYQYQVCILSLC